MTRISELARRDWRARASPFTESLSALLRTDETAHLRLVQAAALLELAENEGVFVNGRVGVGKTLAAALAPAMFEGAVRALVLVPGSMREATNAHFAELRMQWKLPADTLLRTYNFISNLPRQDKSLEDLFGEGRGPTMIICDEADKVRNIRTAACGRQIADYMVAHPECMFVVVTGTCDVEGLLDYGHLLDWCLRDRSPLPRTAHELQDWSDVVDKGDMRKAQWICQDLGIDQQSTLKQIRAAYRDRLTSTPGIIIEDSPFEDVPLTVAEHCIDPGCDADFQRLRELGQRPDGADLAPGDEDELTSIWPVARRMGRGLCYIFDPPPPRDWSRARSKYFGWVRRQIGISEFYTERVARAWADANEEPAWTEWRDIKDTYTPQTRVLWLSDVVLHWCWRWGQQGPGIIWVDDVAFGEALADCTGWTYYGAGNRPRIEDAPGARPCIASRRAHGTGRNLQFQWSRMLFTAPPNTSRDFEQNVGRLHREGQVHPVHVDILLTCHEDFGSIRKVLRGARRTAESLYAQKANSVKWPRAKRLAGPAFEV